MKILTKSKILISSLIILVLIFVFTGLFSVNSILNVAYAQEAEFRKEEYKFEDVQNLAKNSNKINTNYEYLTIFSENGEMEDISVDSNTIDDGSLTPRANFNVHSVVNSGRSNDESIVITIMGDGFTSNEQTTFLTHANSTANYILGTYPFNLFKNYFNIYAVEVHSNETGVSRDSNIFNNNIVDNYFGSTFWHDGVTERLLYVTKASRVQALTQSNNAMTIILANSTRYGGGGGNFSVASLNGSSNKTSVHELGHAFGKLKDEYWWEAGASEAPNMTRTSDPTTVRWSQWVGIDSVGVYAHASSGIGATWYKPHQACLMESLNNQFCKVCSNELNKKMEAIASNIKIFKDFGYTGTSFNWNGAVRMNYNPDAVQDSSGSLKVINKTQLDFELLTISSSNAVSVINGTVAFELKNSAGEIIQSHTSTVKVNLLNKVEINDNKFSIDTYDLENGTYTLTLKSNFERAFWSEEKELTYTFSVDYSKKIMSGFGYTSSWYQWKGKVHLMSDLIETIYYNSLGQMVISLPINLEFTIGTEAAFNAVSKISSNMSFVLRDSQGNIISTHNATSNVGLVSNVTYTNRTFSINTAELPNDTYTLTLNNTSTRSGTTYSQTKTFVFEVKMLTTCVSEGSLITLADGSQKPVEELTGNEQLLVWNLWTGSFDTAPILFIDRDKESVYEVINLGFSDGNSVKVISEHAFWDFDLNKYVFLRRDAAQYIGHWFNKQTTDADGNMIWTKVQLISVDIQNEVTTAWSPVTYGHLCYYVNGMLSMPGATEGLINIFDVNPDTMTIDMDAYLADIAEYGLLSYDDVAEIMNEEVFEAFGGQYCLFP